MEPTGLEIAVVVFGILSLLQAGLLALQTREHARFARQRIAADPLAASSRPAAVIVPCKGLDHELADNLRLLFEQAYGPYELVFVVESASDAACGAIRQLMREYPLRASRLIVAGIAPHGGQKVHNLRRATTLVAAHAEYLAFVDSDARPRRDWLRRLVARLEREGVGAVTGYRWFVPQRWSAANFFVHGANSVVAALYGPGGHYFLWGGSWAIRRDNFERLGIRRSWSGTLSDDLVASRVLRDAELGVHFEPACMVPSPANYDWAGAWEFVRRQYVIGRKYAPRWWLAAVAWGTIANLGFWGGLVASVASVAGSGAAWKLTAPLTAACFLAAVVRGIYRRRLAKTYLASRASCPRSAALADVLLAPLIALAHWTCILSSTFGSSITWRGIRYRIDPSGQARRIDAGRESGQSAVKRPPTRHALPPRRQGILDPTIATNGTTGSLPGSTKPTAHDRR